MKLLCKLVTNPLKPMACAHPIHLCNSLGSGLSDLHHCAGCSIGPWPESVIKFPFLPVALSWRPSLFPLGDSDIGHNTLISYSDSSLRFAILVRHHTSVQSLPRSPSKVSLLSPGCNSILATWSCPNMIMYQAVSCRFRILLIPYVFYPFIRIIQKFLFCN